jgi:hypothetical protein
VKNNRCAPEKAYLSNAKVMHGQKGQDGHKGKGGLQMHVGNVCLRHVSWDGGGYWPGKADRCPLSCAGAFFKMSRSCRMFLRGPGGPENTMRFLHNQQGPISGRLCVVLHSSSNFANSSTPEHALGRKQQSARQALGLPASFDS